MHKIIFDGRVYEKAEPILHCDNRGFRYGDGFFETMRYADGKVMLEQYHRERFYKSIGLLKLIPSDDKLFEIITSQLYSLCKENNCLDAARIRLSVFRGDAIPNSSKHLLHYLVETAKPEHDTYTYNTTGLDVCIYPEVKIACDAFSNLKSANYLPYVMASIYAKEQKCNDALVFNCYERIAESSIANLFWIKEGVIFTPPLSEGCVDGVMRRYLINGFGTLKLNFEEKPCSQLDLSTADEVFLTNAIKGIQWVRKLDGNTYSNERSKFLFDGLLKVFG